MNALIRYFDLLSDVRPKYAQAKAAGLQPHKLHWLPQYLALFLGVLVQPLMQRYMTTGAWVLEGFWQWAPASAVIAVVAFPAAYKGAFDPTKPVFVQLAIIFVGGLGWQSLAGTALKGVSAS